MEINISAIIHPFVNYSGVKRAVLDLKAKADIDLILSLANNGWDASHPVVIVHDTEEAWKAINGEAEMPSRALPEVYDEAVIGSVKLSSADVKAGWETIEINPRAKLKAAVTANRRFAALPYANAIRLQHKLQPILAVPVQQRTVLNIEDLIAINLTENRVASAGVRAVDWSAKLLSAKALFQKGYSEAAIQRTVCLDASGKPQRGQAQAIFAVLSLDAKFPEQGIVDNIMDGTIPMLKREECKLMMALSEEDVDSMLEAKQKGDDIAPKLKPMSKTDIERLRGQSPIKVVQIVCDAILLDNPELLTPIIKRSKRLNDVMAGEIDEPKAENNNNNNNNNNNL